MSYKQVPFEWSRSLTTKVIEQYRQYECLWNSTSAAYKHRPNRENALAEIVETLRPVAPEITMEDIRKKINTLRSQYRKEVKMMEASDRGGGPLYRPKLWCVNELSFLYNDISNGGALVPDYPEVQIFKVRLVECKSLIQI